MTEAEAQRKLQRLVSRETWEALERYKALLLKWQGAINLVSKGTLSSVWSRHFLDSAQIFTLAPPTPRTWMDVGSGGGFPGLVCAVMARETSPDTKFILVESDARKSAFLAQVARELSLNAEIIAQRVEDIPPQSADVISARALAALPTLLSMAHPHFSQSGICLFPKGRSFAEELEEARSSWDMKATVTPSETAADSVILTIEGLSHA